MLIKGNLCEIPENCIIGFDAEWTKNYKIKNGNVPFCFSIIAIKNDKLSFDDLENGDISFEYVQYYCQSTEEFKKLIILAEEWSSKILNALNTCTLCGHQISSDFSVFYNIGRAYEVSSLIYIEQMRREWKKRKTEVLSHIVDTRYDIEQDFLGESRRLVDMCNDFFLDVRQPELKNFSMTKLQNVFYDTHDKAIYERISVMNLRHSLCAVILNWLNEKIISDDQRKYININRSMYKCLKDDFDWIKSKEFSKLLN